MEVGLVGLLVTGAAYLAARAIVDWRPVLLWPIGGLLAAAVFTRDDAAVAVVVICAAIAYRRAAIAARADHDRSRRVPRRPRRVPARPAAADVRRVAPQHLRPEGRRHPQAPARRARCARARLRRGLRARRPVDGRRVRVRGCARAPAHRTRDGRCADRGTAAVCRCRRRRRLGALRVREPVRRHCDRAHRRPGRDRRRRALATRSHARTGAGRGGALRRDDRVRARRAAVQRVLPPRPRDRSPRRPAASCCSSRQVA